MVVASGELGEGGRVEVPRLLSRRPTMWLSAGATVLGALVMAGWAVATETGVNRVMAGLVVAATAAAVAAVVWRRTWLDTGDGTLHHRVAFLPERRVAWVQATTVDLERNRAGQLALRARGERGTVRITLLADDLGGERSARPDLLRVLADEIDRWAPERQRLTSRLRAQADHVESGGALRESPLARHL